MRASGCVRWTSPAAVRWGKDIPDMYVPARAWVDIIISQRSRIPDNCCYSTSEPLQHDIEKYNLAGYRSVPGIPSGALPGLAVADDSGL